MFSSLTVSGLFALRRCPDFEGRFLFQALGNQAATTLDGSRFAYYNSHITCTDNNFISVKIRIHSTNTEALHLNDATAFLTGNAFLDTNEQNSFIDVSNFTILDNCFNLPRDPSFFSTFFDCLGTVCGDSYVLDDEDASVVFPVLVRNCVLDDVKSSRLMYEFFLFFLILTHVFRQVLLFRTKFTVGNHSRPFPRH